MRTAIRFPTLARQVSTRPVTAPRLTRNFQTSHKRAEWNYRRPPQEERGRPQYRRFDEPAYGGSGAGGSRFQQSGAGANALNYVKRRVGGDRGLVVYGVGIALGGAYYVYHLERVPITGRLRFMDCSPEQEAEIGTATFDETMQQFQGAIMPPNHPITRRVRDIAVRIVERNGLGKVKSGHTLSSLEGIVPGWGGGGGDRGDDINIFTGQGVDGAIKAFESIGVPDQNSEWEVYVVNEPKTKNAFVIPGGKIFVFTGILPVAANDDGLAIVMGHEIAHVVARHGAERMSSMKVLFGVSFLLETLGLDVGLTRLLVTFMMQLPNSRTNEREADTIGLQLTARACYNPNEGPKLWERMNEEGGGGRIDFMSTHPANAKRIRNLEKEMRLADDILQQSCGDMAGQAEGFRHALQRTVWR